MAAVVSTASNRALPLLEPLGATFIVVRGVIPSKTPDRFKQAHHFIEDRYCKNGGDHAGPNSTVDIDALAAYYADPAYEA